MGPSALTLKKKYKKRGNKKDVRQNGIEKHIIGCKGAIKFCQEKNIKMFMMFTFKKLSFSHSSSLPVQVIFDPFKENVKPRLPPGHKTGKD